MSITDTEREADLQAALSRAANHRPQPGDWRKLKPARHAAWSADFPDTEDQNPPIAPQNAPGATQTPGRAPDSPETAQDATGVDS